MRPPKSRTTPPRDNTTSSLWDRLGDYLTIPMRLALAPIIGFLFGRALDRWWGTFPGATLALLVLGFVEGAREVWMSVKDFRKNPR